MLHVAQQYKAFGSDTAGQVVWRDGDISRPYSMATYVIGIGSNNTYLYPGSTRTQYSTYWERVGQFKKYINGLALSYNDEIIEWRYIYAHRIGDVRRCYPDALDERRKGNSYDLQALQALD